MSMNMTSFNWNNLSSFVVYIQNDEIYSCDGQKIGVILKKYQEVEDGLIKCKNRLIELGEIKIPKTQEEIIKEQSEMIEKQQALLNDLINKMGGQNGCSTINFKSDSERQTTTSDTDGNGSDKKNKSSKHK